MACTILQKKKKNPQFITPFKKWEKTIFQVFKLYSKINVEIKH